MQTINRRRFGGQLVVASVATGSLLTTPAAGVHQASTTRPLRIAFIGVGGRGGANLKAISQDTDVVVSAICDVDRRKTEAARKAFASARVYSDFRQLYREADDIDAVVVSTAEHTHAFATMPALRMGKHVYCEKPLTHNVAEARAITRAAAAAKVATQMGTQIHASENYHRVVQLIGAGVIGDVTDVHVWVNRAWGLQSEAESKLHKDIVYVTERPSMAMPVPDHLDWDLWLGPAPWREYHDVYFPGPKWYRWWDFGNGTMSDLGSHWVDLPFWALNLDAPTEIEAEGDQPHAEIAPASMIARYKYPANSNRPACNLTWYQGQYKPKVWLDGEIPQWPSGVLFVGTGGMLLSDYRKHHLLPEGAIDAAELPEPDYTAPVSHHQQWLEACRTGSPTGSPFSYAGPLTEANHLGNVAFRAGEALRWDSQAMRVTNTRAADPFIARSPRDGWSLDG